MNRSRVEYARRFGLPLTRTHHMDSHLVKQLDACPDDLARRLLLGISEKTTAASSEEEMTTESEA